MTAVSPMPSSMPTTRGYQQEMLEESLHNNIIIALDTGSGKTLIAVLRMKHEIERESLKISWFFAPTVALCEQQKAVIQTYLPVSVGLISGSLQPEQWKDAALWHNALKTHRIMVSTPQVFLDALRHGYLVLGRDISLLVFDEAHHAVDNHPYNRIMVEFYFDLPSRAQSSSNDYVRPMVLGLTASPIYGGNVVKAFQTLERNMDSIIRSPRINRAELATFVHRPIFRHVLYSPINETNPPFSTNLAALCAVVDTLNIENDPYVKGLRRELGKTRPSTMERLRLDQKLSEVIAKENAYSTKGLKDFARTAREICEDLGPWAADWYISKVIEQAKRVANPFNDFMARNFKNQERAYLINTLNKVVISPVSYHPDDIVDDSSDKVRVLMECLLTEKEDAELNNEPYSGIIFVQRRDTVLALAELLFHHPCSCGIFRIGCLLGSSENAFRRSFLDITRQLLNISQESTLADFRIGEKNLIVSTAVAEEGIDIQACGSVIRWDPPQNMASWAQSRGRARRARSTYTLMFKAGGIQQRDVTKWENLEKEMVALYNDPERDMMIVDELPETVEVEEEELLFQVDSTGALLSLDSAISHLAHFCAVIPNRAHVDNRPLYDLDPPDYQEGWHSFDNRSHNNTPYQGPWGSKVTLPRTLPPEIREFSTKCIYSTKISAYRHAAYIAYRKLYEVGLLNDHLLPITSIVEPQLEEDVKEMLRNVEKRSGMATVSLQMDPWASEIELDNWYQSELLIQGLPSLQLFSRCQPVLLDETDGPILYRPFRDPIRVGVRPIGKVDHRDQCIPKARDYTRRLFWSLNGSRMDWDRLDFSTLFLPFGDVDDSPWQLRRDWSSAINRERMRPLGEEFSASASLFGKEFSFPEDLTIIRRDFHFGKPYQFVRWRSEPLTEEEEADLRAANARIPNLEIVYPLLVVKPFPARTNFLIPIPPNEGPAPEERHHILLPRTSTVTLISAIDTEYAFLLPSIIRFLSMTLTVDSLRRSLLTPQSPLFEIPMPLLRTAMTAPVTGDRENYQRLETLGDTVLKFVCGVQLLAEYPLWHEGYLTKKKDHSVSNVRLAKENIARNLYRWIIRDRMLGRKWKPNYLTQGLEGQEGLLGLSATVKQDETLPQNKKKSKQQELSTKVLADVVEALIGAAYLHGSFDLGYECAKFFGLGLKWESFPTRVSQILDRLGNDPDSIPTQISSVEEMIGYTFRHKILLIEALTHASYQQDLSTVSYERMEFLGDSVLDMVVTDYLYHAPGKRYSPGHIHLRRSAVVNTHFLAYICLRNNARIASSMPRSSGEGEIKLAVNDQEIYLWQCLLHSSPKVLEDQYNTFARFRRREAEIEEALEQGSIFPWAALTRLQAPKFLSDMIESLIGAVYLDSNGDISMAQKVINHLGIMKILDRIVKDDLDVLHPVSRLSQWASKKYKSIQYVFEKEKGAISCVIMVDEKEEVRVTEQYRGAASQEEVKFQAAEQAIQLFRLRDVNVNYMLMKRKNKRKTKQKKI